MSRSSDAVKNWRRRTKERIVAAMGGKCVICGYSRCMESLACHHLNPEEKDFGISQWRADPRSWAKIVEELRKCVLLCNNCHGELHAGIIAIPVNTSRFDESYVIYKLPSNIPTHKCPSCEVIVPDTQQFCSLVCSGKFKRPMVGKPGRPKKLAPQGGLEPPS